MTKKEKFWFWFLLGLMLLGWLTSCKTQYVSVPEHHTVYVEKHDTLITRDSIFQKDSVYMWMQGDTIWKEKYSIIYKDRWRDKIVYRDSVRVDSLRIPVPVERQLNLWERTVLAVAKPLISIVVVALLLFLIWIRVRKV